MKSPIHELFTAGCWRSAMAHALMMRSLKETLTGDSSLIALRASMALSMVTVIRR